MWTTASFETDYSSPFNFAWNTWFAAPGSAHTLTAVTYDQAGRTMGQAAIQVSVATELQRAAISDLNPASAASVGATTASSPLYSSAVSTLAEAGVVSGFQDGTFGAAGTTTRAQVAKMVAGALGIADSDAIATPFTDLGPMDAQLYPQKYVAALFSVGAVRESPLGDSHRTSQ